METKNDVLYYLKKIDFTDKVNDDDIENLRCVKEILVSGFNYNIPKLIDVSNLVDNLFISLMIGEFPDILIETDTLGENILYLISFKHFVESRCESY